MFIWISIVITIIYTTLDIVESVDDSFKLYKLKEIMYYVCIHGGILGLILWSPISVIWQIYLLCGKWLQWNLECRIELLLLLLCFRLECEQDISELQCNPLISTLYQHFSISTCFQIPEFFLQYFSSLISTYYISQFSYIDILLAKFRR